MDKIEIKKKQGSIVEALRDAILSGSIPADTEMTQNELAQSLGVSRMPVREALIILEYQGLIRRLPNNHVRVVPQTREYIAELFRMCGDLCVPLLCKMVLVHKDSTFTMYLQSRHGLGVGVCGQILSLIYE